MKPIRQHDASDCAAACLAMVASHFHKRISLAVTRDLIGTDRDGATLRGLLDGAGALGLEAEAIKGDVTAFGRTVPTPCIAHVYREDGPHFVVIRRIGRRFVTLLDPALGKRRVTLSDFTTEWSGYLVVMAPGDGFERGGSKSAGLLRFVPLLRPYYGTIGWTVSRLR